MVTIIIIVYDTFSPRLLLGRRIASHSDSYIIIITIHHRAHNKPNQLQFVRGPSNFQISPSILTTWSFDFFFICVYSVEHTHGREHNNPLHVWLLSCSYTMWSWDRNKNMHFKKLNSDHRYRTDSKSRNIEPFFYVHVATQIVCVVENHRPGKKLFYMFIQ